MKKLCMSLALVAALVGTASAADQMPARPATIGGGVKHPWTSPYVLAVVTPETSRSVTSGVGA